MVTGMHFIKVANCSGNDLLYEQSHKITKVIFTEVPFMAGTASLLSDAIRNERTTKQTDPFQANPLGRGQLTDFLSRGRGTHSSRIDLDMLVDRALKISQLTPQPRGGRSPTYDTMH